MPENHFPLPKAAAAAAAAAAAFPLPCLHSWIEKEERRKGRKEKLWVRIFSPSGAEQTRSNRSRLMQNFTEKKKF